VAPFFIRLGEGCLASLIGSHRDCSVEIAGGITLAESLVSSSKSRKNRNTQYFRILCLTMSVFEPNIRPG
jgi:hypothetical protein